MHNLKLTALAATTLVTILPAPTATADLTVSGSFQYEDHLYTPNGYSGQDVLLPVRFANVDVLDNATGAVLASGITDASGSVAIGVPGTGNADLVVRCRARTDRYGTIVRVRRGVMPAYDVTSAVYNNWDLDQDLDFGVITEVDAVYTVGNKSAVGNPFNIYDQAIDALEFASAFGGPLTNDININYPVTAGTSTTGNGLRINYTQGLSDSDVLHELGHVIDVQYGYGWGTSGSTHSFSDYNLQPGDALKEAWADFFPSMIKRARGDNFPSWYLRVITNVHGFLTVNATDLEDGAPLIDPEGEGSEIAIAAVLWDILDTHADWATGDDDLLNGTAPIPGAGSGLRAIMGLALNGAHKDSMNEAWKQWTTINGYGSFYELRQIAFDWGMAVYPDNLEPNDTIADASPLLPLGNWEPIKTLYASSNNLACGEGDRDFYAVSVSAGDRLRIETQYPGLPAFVTPIRSIEARTGCDPFVALYAPDGTLVATDEDSGLDRNALLEWDIDVTGTWYIEVTTTAPFARLVGRYQLNVLAN